MARGAFFHLPRPLYVSALHDSPLIRFRPTLLFLDVLCGGLLAVVATVIPAYWLRVRGRPVQFSLRALFGLMTVVACSLGILKFCAPRWLDPELVLAVIVILLPRLLLYAIPAGLVVVAAHWTVIRSTSSTRRCRWLGIHWLSWLAVAAVGGPFFHYSLIAYTGMVAVELPALAIKIAAGYPALRVVLGYGWPLTYWSVGPLDTYLAPLSLVADAVVWLTATVATGFIVERWVRRVEQRVSMRPSAFLSALFVACVLIWVLSNDHSYHRDWYDYPPWLLGIAVMVYAAELLVLRQLNLVARTSLLAGLGVGVAYWISQSQSLGGCGVGGAFSLAVGSLAVLAIDAGYRLLSHRDRGISRFVRRDCGGCVAAVPAWVVATAGVLAGLALIYWRS